MWTYLFMFWQISEKKKNPESLDILFFFSLLGNTLWLLRWLRFASEEPAVFSLEPSVKPTKSSSCFWSLQPCQFSDWNSLRPGFVFYLYNTDLSHLQKLQEKKWCSLDVYDWAWLSFLSSRPVSKLFTMANSLYSFVSWYLFSSTVSAPMSQHPPVYWTHFIVFLCVFNRLLRWQTHWCTRGASSKEKEVLTDPESTAYMLIAWSGICCETRLLGWQGHCGTGGASSQEKRSLNGPESTPCMLIAWSGACCEISIGWCSYY